MSANSEALYQAILQRIESYCNDNFCEDLSLRSFTDHIDMDPDLKECIKRLTDIYTIVHAFNKNHICYHVHDAWRKPILDLIPLEQTIETAQMETINEH